MRERLHRAMALVLHDLDMTGAPLPRVEDSDWQGFPGAESAYLFSADESGTGVWVDGFVSEAEQVVMLADQVQEWAVEELARTGRPTNWPTCPEHPANHPLAAAVKDGAATWTCPRSGVRVDDVGFLAPPGELIADRPR